MPREPEAFSFLKEYLKDVHGYSPFEVSIASLARDLGLTTNKIRYALRLLEERGIVKRQRQSCRGKNPKYIFIEEAAKAITAEKENQDKPDLVCDTFENVDVKLVRWNDEYVVSFADVARVIGIANSSVHQLVNNHWDVFKNIVIKVSKAGLKTQKCFTRQGLIMYMQKVNSMRVKKQSADKVRRFQLWVVEKIDELLSKGRVEIAPEEHEEVYNLLGGILDSKDETVKALFDDLQQSIDNIVQFVRRQEKAAYEIKDKEKRKKFKKLQSERDALYKFYLKSRSVG